MFKCSYLFVEKCRIYVSIRNMDGETNLNIQKHLTKMNIFKFKYTSKNK
ncbi:hypothetical protein UT300005_14460 [Clostridium sp. CTA-5]